MMEKSARGKKTENHWTKVYMTATDLQLSCRLYTKVELMACASFSIVVIKLLCT